MPEISMQDIMALQREAGAAENDERLRRIVAERRVMELEARLAELEAIGNNKSQ